MTKAEQKEFLDDILASLKKDIEVRLDYIPENWDGIELRQWVLDLIQFRYTTPKKAFPRNRKIAYNKIIYTDYNLT